MKRAIPFRKRFAWDWHTTPDGGWSLRVVFVCFVLFACKYYPDWATCDLKTRLSLAFIPVSLEEGDMLPHWDIFSRTDATEYM